MSDERRRRRRQRRERRRRDRGQSFEAVGPMQFPGMFGWLQRRQRVFYAVGIVVLVVSLGAVFFGGGQAGPTGPTPASPTPEPTTAAGDDTSDAASDGSTDDTGDSAGATGTPDDSAAATDTADDEQTDDRAYSGPPPLTIDPEGSYEAVIHTEKGSVRIELLASDAPGYVNNFVFLARDGFYDGITFHRVIPGFVAQAGDPTGTGLHSSGYDLAEELNDLPFDAGVLSMAKAGNTVSGSQFFITLEPTPHLAESGFTVFGRVIEGLDVLRTLTPRDPSAPGQPPGDRILGIDIVEGGE